RLSRAQHPFPTRRSSDLDHLSQLIERRRNRLLAQNVNAAFRGQTDEGQVRIGPRANLDEIRPFTFKHLRGVRVRGANAVLASRLDRKSTRLNSSHVSISY